MQREADILLCSVLRSIAVIAFKNTERLIANMIEMCNFLHVAKTQTHIFIFHEFCI